MEEELVSTLFPDFTEGNAIHLRSPFAYTKYFRETLPYMMVMGMTPDEYWDGDPDLALAYRQAWELKQEAEFNIRNEYAWINNMYTYAVMCKVAPLFSSFADNKTKPGEYMEEPFDFSKEVDEEAEMEKQREKARAVMETWAINTNQRMKKQ